jgi:hypothetical protein
MSRAAASALSPSPGGMPFRPAQKAALGPGTLEEPGSEGADEAVHAAASQLHDDELRIMEDHPPAHRIGARVGQHLPLPERLVAKCSLLAAP